MTSPSSGTGTTWPRGATMQDLPRSLVLLLAIGAGLSVATLYYSQPMLGVLGAAVGVSDRAIGLVPTLTQLGYALGILLLAPLGDRYERRRIILAKTGVLAGALLLAAFAKDLGTLLVASLVTGLAATLAQDILPAAATLAPVVHRGKVLGTVMTGLLLGILLSRVLSGVVAEHFGFRVVFLGAAVTIASLLVAMWRRLPRFEPTTSLGYVALLGSLAALLRRYGSLRRAALAQGLLSIGFSAFWSMLAIMLHGAPFHLGSTVAGAFGLAGAAGALAAPLAGRIADRRGPELVTRLGSALAAVAFATMALLPWLSMHGRLWLLGASAIVFDFGIQGALVAHQTIVYGMDSSARSRVNAILLVGMFIGMACGSAIASVLFAQWGWSAIVVLATASALAALLVRVWPMGTRAAGVETPS